MRRIQALALILAILLFGCSRSGDDSVSEATEPLDSDSGYVDVMADGDVPGVFMPDEKLTPSSVVAAYFEQMYLSYVSNNYIDLSSILDMRQSVNQNLVTWTEMLLQRRRLIMEYDLAYVETRTLPYSISFVEEAGDGRMEFWNARGQSQMPGEVILHFIITGDDGEAYPPLMAMNSVHTMRLMEVDGLWKITFHYFPGSVRKYYRSGALEPVDDEERLERLMVEFGNVETSAQPLEIPAGATAYNAGRAVDYAIKYTESRNYSFYHIGDWMGNCQNFISQTVWYGFSGKDEPSVEAMDNMTGRWFAGAGGGSPAWENVGYFWDYITGQGAFRSLPIGGVAELKSGDVIQTRSLSYSSSEQGYSHSLFVVDEETLKLAQNSPGCFVYYSDVLNVETRMARPVYLLA